MSKKIEIEIPEGKVAEWKEINGVRKINKKYHKIKLNFLRKVASYKLYMYLCKSFGK